MDKIPSQILKGEEEMEEEIQIDENNSGYLQQIILDDLTEKENNELSFQTKRREVNSQNILKGVPLEQIGMICCTAIYKDRYLFLGSSQGLVACYDLVLNKVLTKVKDHIDWVLSLLVITLEGRDMLLSGAGLYDRTLGFYPLNKIGNDDFQLELEARRYQVHIKSITKMLFIQQNNLLLTCGSDQKLKIWKLSNTALKSKSTNLKVGLQSFNYSKLKNEEQEEIIEEPSRYLQMKILQILSEEGQIYSICESDNGLVVYGTGNGIIKVIELSCKGKAKGVRYFKVPRSVWSLVRFIHLFNLVGYSLQTEGRVSIINVVTGQHIFNVFQFNDHIHSFSIIYKQSQIPNQKIVIQNKTDFINSTKNCVTIVGLSKLGMIKVHNLGEKSNPAQLAFIYDQNIMWIPWSPFVIIPKIGQSLESDIEENQSDQNSEIEAADQNEIKQLEGEFEITDKNEIEQVEGKVEDEEPLEKYTIFCSTGNNGTSNNKKNYPLLVKVDWCV